MATIQGELPFTGIEPQVHDGTIPFGRIIKHREILGFDADDYTIPSTQDVARVHHAYLDRSLHGVGSGRFATDDLSFTPEDYAVIPRSFAALRSKASRGVYEAHVDQDIDPDETDAAAHRAELHIVMSSRDKLVAYREALRDRRESLRILRMQIDHPNRAMLHEHAWQSLLRSVYTDTLTPMIRAAVLQRSRPLADVEAMQPALAYSLMGPESNRYKWRMQNWNDIAGLAMKYTVLRGQLATEKIRKANEILAVEEQPMANPA